MTSLDILRAATRDAHQQVEVMVERLGVLNDATAFLRHLRLLHAHHQALADSLTAHQYSLTRVSERVKELRHDIEVMSAIAPCTQVGNTVGFPTHIGDSLAAGLGACYVVEGSRLGAAAIGRQLRQVESIPTHQLVSVGGEPTAIRARWREFCARLTEVPTADFSSLASGAQRTFGSLVNAYEGWVAQTYPHTS